MKTFPYPLFSAPAIMGILNVTEDSFFDGGCYVSMEAAMQRVEGMLSEGADIIDVGAVSTRPGSAEVPAEEEWRRLQPVLAAITREFPGTLISVDTWRADVAERSVNAGASIINDISGGKFDSRMADVVGQMGVPYVLMHTTAKPDRMQQETMGDNMLADMLRFFGERIELFQKKGCKDIIIDPGFGFGKTLEQNYLLLNQLQVFQVFEKPILVGISRKSMIYKALKTEPRWALNGTTVLNTIALLKGAAVLRVHDVREAVEARKLVELYRK